MPQPKAGEDAGGRVSNIPLTARQDVSSGTSDEGLVEPTDPAAGPRQVGAFQQRVVEMDGVRVGIVGGKVVTGPRMRSARGQDTLSDLAWQPGDPICAPQRVDRRDRRGVDRTRPSENQEPGEPGYNSYHLVPLRSAPAGAVMMAVPSERDPHGRIKYQIRAEAPVRPISQLDGCTLATCSPTGVSRAFNTAPDAERILGRPSRAASLL
jgi:hypothetical protein